MPGDARDWILLGPSLLILVAIAVFALTTKGPRPPEPPPPPRGKHHRP